MPESHPFDANELLMIRAACTTWLAGDAPDHRAALIDGLRPELYSEHDDGEELGKVVDRLLPMLEDQRVNLAEYAAHVMPLMCDRIETLRHTLELTQRERDTAAERYEKLRAEAVRRWRPDSEVDV